jgi:hypothetical protein
MSDTKLCSCVACTSSRAGARTTPIPAPDLATAIKAHRANDTAEAQQLRVVAALKANPVATEQE